MQNKLFVRIMILLLIAAMVVPSFAFALAWMLS